MTDKDLDVLNAHVSTVMSTEAGRAVIWEIMAMCQIYTDNSAEADKAIEGKRSVGLEIIAMLIDADPQIYPKLMMEKDTSYG